MVYKSERNIVLAQPGYFVVFIPGNDPLISHAGERPMMKSRNIQAVTLLRACCTDEEFDEIGDAYEEGRQVSLDAAGSLIKTNVDLPENLEELLSGD